MQSAEPHIPSSDGEPSLRPSTGGNEKIYGLRRVVPSGGVSGAWTVGLRRQGRSITRTFKDSAYGSSEIGFAQALAFRDAILDALPPMTNREGRVMLRSDNTSGATDIYRSSNGGRLWIAYFTLNGEARTKGFSVSQHGDEGAMAFAVAQRREWVAELDPAFRTSDPFADTKAHERFAERLERVPVHYADCRLHGKIDAVLAAIGDHFDVRRPHRLWLTLHLDAQDRLRGLATYQTNGQIRRLQRTTGTRSRRGDEAARCALDAMEQMIGELCGMDQARAVMAERRKEWSAMPDEAMRAGVHASVFLPSTPQSSEC